MDWTTEMVDYWNGHFFYAEVPGLISLLTALPPYMPVPLGIVLFLSYMQVGARHVHN